MSYWVNLLIDTGAPEPIEVWSRNHTSNIAGVWRTAGCDLREFDGKTAIELGEAAGNAIIEILENRDKYTEFEPGNGWGDITSTIAFLQAIHNACKLHPKTIVHVSY